MAHHGAVAMRLQKFEMALTAWACAQHDKLAAMMRAKTEVVETAVGVMLIGGLGAIGSMLPHSF